jgi:hypothetical protein
MRLPVQIYPKIIALTLFLIIPVLGICADSTLQGTYVSSVILTAPWGQKNLFMDKEPSPPGEFGIFDQYSRDPSVVDQGPVQGPSTFTMAPAGDIYICDIYNSRIQRFSPEGNFISAIPMKERVADEDIAVDQEGNIYVLTVVSSPVLVWKYDQNGNGIKEYKMFNDADAAGMNYGNSTHLYCDKSGRLFLSYYKANEKTQAVFQFGTNTVEFTPGQQKATLRKGSAGVSGIILNKEQLFQSINGAVFSVDNLGKSVTEFKSLGSYSFLDADASGYAYLTFYNMENDMYSVRKQAPDGKIISSFEWRYPRYQLSNSPTPVSVRTNKALTIDAQGNVYVLVLTNSGVTITKWSPVGGK